MILFIDTEWADTLANEIVSMALVSDCGSFEFYAERDPLPLRPVEFVRSTVYPLLDRSRALLDAQFVHELHVFFGQAQAASRPDRLMVAYDHRNDLDLLGYALEGFELPETPPRPSFGLLELAKLGPAFNATVEELFRTDGARAAKRHNALVDARVNRDAWLALNRPVPGASLR